MSKLIKVGGRWIQPASITHLTEVRGLGGEPVVQTRISFSGQSFPPTHDIMVNDTAVEVAAKINGQL